MLRSSLKHFINTEKDPDDIYTIDMFEETKANDVRRNTRLY
jgi:hypothetical protein